MDEIAARQYGVIGREQAIAAGLTSSAISRRCKSGRWERILPGVYRIRGAPDSWRQRVIAAQIWLGVDSYVSHQSAAAVLGIGGVVEGPVELTATRKLRPRNGVRVHFAVEMPRKDTTVVDGFRVTTATRTIIDLASVVSPKQLAAALDDALRKRLTSVPTTRAAMVRLGTNGKSGTRLLSRLLDERSQQTRPTDTELEDLAISIIRKAGLPEPEIQNVILNDGGFVARVDLAYPDRMLVIEAESWQYHSTMKDWSDDVVHYNDLVGLGWRVMRVTHEEMIKRPDRVADQIRRAHASGFGGGRGRLRSV